VPESSFGTGDGDTDDAEDEEAHLLSGNRVEVKNMNSVRHMVAAASYEASRQASLLARGDLVAPETRGFDPRAKVTYFQRSKEDAYDYRFMPEPDMPPVHVSSAEVERLRASLPELPEPMKKRLVSEYGISEHEARVLVAEPRAARFFQEVARADLHALPAAAAAEGAVGGKGVEFAERHVPPRAAAVWICNYLSVPSAHPLHTTSLCKHAPKQNQLSHTYILGTKESTRRGRFISSFLPSSCLPRSSLLPPLTHTHTLGTGL